MDCESTYRLISLLHKELVGRTAATIKLAKLSLNDLRTHTDGCLGLEMTDWVEEYGKPKIRRTVLIEAEEFPLQWTVPAED